MTQPNTLPATEWIRRDPHHLNESKGHSMTHFAVSKAKRKRGAPHRCAGNRCAALIHKGRLCPACAEPSGHGGRDE